MIDLREPCLQKKERRYLLSQFTDIRFVKSWVQYVQTLQEEISVLLRVFKVTCNVCGESRIFCMPDNVYQFAVEHEEKHGKLSLSIVELKGIRPLAYC
jgi:predicted nucleotidyltransferase